MSEQILFVGGPAHGQVLEVYADASLWRLIGGGTAYRRVTAYEHGPYLPDFFHVMSVTDSPPMVADALKLARATGRPGPTYVRRSACPPRRPQHERTQ